MLFIVIYFLKVSDAIATIIIISCCFSVDIVGAVLVLMLVPLLSLILPDGDAIES